MKISQKKRIAIVGGGPSGLFVYKRIVEVNPENIIVEIFEAGSSLGKGMPYSDIGANREHITNVSGNEIPDIMLPLMEWMKTLPKEKLLPYQIDPAHFSDYRVLPRLLFGEYLNDQFELLQAQAKSLGLITKVHFNTRVNDIKDLPDKNAVRIEFDSQGSFEYDFVVICTGHEWPLAKEGKIPGYYDSPYPPAKLRKAFNHPVAIRGSSLTAIDAIRTIARSNGQFIQHDAHHVSYIPNENLPAFKLVMHSRQGLLPAIRFHLEDPRLKNKSLLTSEEITAHRKQNEGFLSLDFIFEKDFKDSFREKDPEFYERIKHMQLEDFVELMMGMRESQDPFSFFKAEYQEALESIRQHKSVYWKEMLAILSFAMNYPAKHFSAEDMLRLQKVLMPLISLVIAFVPQSSCEELIALHAAGKLELIAVVDESRVETTDQEIRYHYTDEKGNDQDPTFKTFVDCIGQRHLSLEEFPFKSLITDETLSPAKLDFKSANRAEELEQQGNKKVVKNASGSYHLHVPGIAIDDNFRVIDKAGNVSARIYLMAVSYLGGYNPDYSGLDFCEEASKIIVKNILQGKGGHLANA
jgi:uncharacterized NAD(P)/FAD-binding protein YdhS